MSTELHEYETPAPGSNEGEAAEPAPPSFIDENRVGHFRIAQLYLEGDPAGLLQLFAHMIVVRCEYKYEWKAMEYVAYSPLFEPCPAHGLAPEYLFDIGVHDGPRLVPPDMRALTIHIPPAPVADTEEPKKEGP